MDIAIIATECPIPLSIRSARNCRVHALPLMTPPWSVYRIVADPGCTSTQIHHDHGTPLVRAADR
jgi:hypothetical protein